LLSKFELVTQRLQANLFVKNYNYLEKNLAMIDQMVWKFTFVINKFIIEEIWRSRFRERYYHERSESNENVFE